MNRIVIIWILLLTALQSAGQQLIDPKGTKVAVDTSKWKLGGTDIYNKNNGNVGIGTSLPQYKLDVTGKLRVTDSFIANSARLVAVPSGTASDSLLTRDANGIINMIAVSRLNKNDSTTASNGLTLTGKDVRLGGNLVQATTVTQNSQTFTLATGGTAFNITGLPSGSPTDSVLVQTNAGLVRRIASSQLNKADSTTASNGLTLSSKDVRLGGNLTQATTVTQNGQTFTLATGGTAFNITGLPSGSPTDSVLVQTNAGLVRRIASSQLNKADSTTASNGLTLSSKDVRLGGNLTQATTITQNSQTFTIATGGTAFNITGLPTGSTSDSMLTVNNGQVKKITSVFPVVAEIYDAAGGQSIGTSFTSLTMSSSGVVDAGYTAASNSITVSAAGTYRITFRGTLAVTNNTRSGAQFRITKNGSAVAGTLAATYLRNNDVDEGSATIVKIIQLAAGDVIAGQAKRYSSSGNLSTVADGSSLIIEKIK